MMTLRPVTRADSGFLFRLACDAEVRARSFHQATPTEDEHLDWFSAFFPNNSILKWIIVRGDESIGAVWVQHKGERAIITAHLLPGARSQGVGGQVIREAVDRAHAEWRVPILAYIKRDNTRSQRAFQKAGFRETGMGMVKDDPVLIFTYIPDADPVVD